MEKYIVLETEENIRIDNYIASKTNISRSKIQDLIKQMKVEGRQQDIQSTLDHIKETCK